MDNKDTLISHWLKGSDDALETAEDLYRLKHYNFCLFFCHLAIEKLIKALLVKLDKQVTPIHNLTTLFRESNLEISTDWLENLEEMNSFNVKARYDDIKNELYRKATPPYTQKFLDFSKEFILWLKKQT